MKRLSLSLLVVLMAATSLFAGVKIKPVQGDASVLKGQKKMNIIFTFDGLRVGKEPSEETYLQTRTAERNKKNPGSGDRWAKSWQRDKEEIYPEKFTYLFNKIAAETHKIQVDPTAKDAKYTMNVHATWIEPGFNIPNVMKRPALVDFEITIYETANPSNIVYKALIIKAPGASFMGADIDTGIRIGESYAISGKYLSSFLYKKYLKK